MKSIRKHISVLLTLVMIISMFSMVDFSVFAVGTIWDGSVAEKFNSGSGTQQDPYIIKTAEELAYLSQQVEYGESYDECYFELGADIILNDTTNWELWGTYNEDDQLIAPVNSWKPIGAYFNYYYCSFDGFFDGKGYTVKGVYVNNITANYYGLFGYSDGLIKNINVEQSYIKGSDNSSRTGGICGSGNVENASFKGTVISGGSLFCGGIVGYGSAVNCINYANVTGEGGIVGQGEATYCINYGTLYEATGGICGSGTAKYCYNKGDIYSADETVGGVIGNAYSYSPEEVTEYCFNSGNIYVESGWYNSVGGVVGSGIAKECYNSGNIYLSSETEGCTVGGVIGSVEVNFEMGSLNCYNSGNVENSGTETLIGAVIGDNNDELEIKGCYYLENLNYTDQFATALSAEQMKTADSFKGWNFNRIWEYGGDGEYPYPTLRCFGSKEYCYAVGFYDSEIFLETKLVVENGKIILHSLSDKQDIKFYGWENNGKIYFPGDEFLVSEDTTFRAVYRKINSDSKTWDSSVDNEWQGSGTKDEPYLISSAAELAGLSQMVNEGNDFYDSYFSLTEDIYLNDVSSAYNYFTIAENFWTPIGNYDNNFRGYFNGNDHTVNGIYIRSSEQDLGLFGYMNYGGIENINIEYSHLYTTFNRDQETNNAYTAGLLLGYSNYTLISDCTVKGEVKVVFSKYYNEQFYLQGFTAGGIVGRNYGGSIENCVNYCDVNMTAINTSAGAIEYTDGYIGGIAGYAGSIYDSINYGSVSISDFKTSNSYNMDVYLGGISGRASDLVNCVNHGSVTADKVGTIEHQDEPVTIAGISAVVSVSAVNCINNGEVYGYCIAAGIAGKNWNDTVTVKDCVNNADVKGSTVGGIFSRLHNGHSIILSCINNGDLSLNPTGMNSDFSIGGIMATGSSAQDCINNGKITVELKLSYNDRCYIGGIFGQLNTVNNEGDKNLVLRCANYGNITVNDFSSCQIGGIGGATNKYNEIKDCYNKGNITASCNDNYDDAIDAVGGIVGNGNVSDSYNEGRINITQLDPDDSSDVYIGGVVGKGTVKNSYNIGKLTITDTTENSYEVHIGGAIGFADSETINSFYLNSCVTGDFSGNSLGVALSSEQLSRKSTFSGWDFNKTWEFGGIQGYSYPNLRFIGSKTFNYYLEFIDGDNVIFKKLLIGGSEIDFSAPYISDKYTFAYWEKDGKYYRPEDTLELSEDSVFTAVWQSKNSGQNVWDGSADTEWKGSGTEQNPYLITSPEELAGLAQKVNESSKNTFEGCYFKQTADIYLNDINNYSSTLLAENIWTPIGNGNRYFNGNYDGNGFKISGVYIKGNANDLNSAFYGCLFGSVQNATFKNLTIDNSYISFTTSDDYHYYTYLSGIVGYSRNSVTFENCHNKATLCAPESLYVGGLVAFANYNISAIGCSNSGALTGEYVGGIAGEFNRGSETQVADFKECVNNGKIQVSPYSYGCVGGILGGNLNTGGYVDISFSDCNNYGEIFAENTTADCGGIAGITNSYTYIKNCNNYAKITGNSGVGGIIGHNTSNEGATIDKCTNNGEIYGEKNCGGISGYGRIYITDCENNADIHCKDKYAGGITGVSWSGVYNCVNNGNVSGAEYIGGITGEAESYVHNCVNNAIITADDNAGGIAGSVRSGFYVNISNCINNGNVTSAGEAGGIASESYYDTRITACSNTAQIQGESYVGGIIGDGYYDNPISNCYNTGNINATDSRVGGIVGEGCAQNCYNSGNVYSEEGYVGGIVGDGDATNCYNTANIYGESNVGGICGSGDVTTCYNIGNVTATKYSAGALTGYDYDRVTDSYYLDSISVSVLNDGIIVDKGTAVDSDTLASNSLSGFDFETTWTVGETEDYIYPTLTGNVHEVTYKVTFLDADGIKVLKEQTVRRGWSAYPPAVEVTTDGTYVYAIDHWDAEYKNITKDTTVKAVYKKTEIIKFLSSQSQITVPFGYSKDNLRVDIESAYLRLLMTTTHDYQMKCDVVWDMSMYNPNAAGEYIITGYLKITDSPYYKMEDNQTVTIKVVVEEGDVSVFDESQLSYTLNSDNTATITGYSGMAENIRIPQKLDGYVVSAIADNAFINNKALVTLYIPDTVKSIGNSSFKGNTSLVQVTFNEGITDIGEYAFSDTALTNVTLPKSLENIGKCAFGTYDGENIVNGFVIYAYSDTAAVTYAQQSQIAFVSISVKTDANTGIFVTAEDSVELAVSQVVGGDYFDTANNIIESDSNVSLFEIKLVDSGDKETQPGNMMTVSIPVPKGFTGSDCKIFRINADGSYKDMNAQFVGGRLVFNTAHLSYYAVISENTAVLGDVNGDGEVNTKDLAVLKLYLAGKDITIIAGADINADGEINTVDLAALKIKLAGL